MYLLSIGWGDKSLPKDKLLLSRAPRIITPNFPQDVSPNMHSRICILGSYIVAIHISSLSYINLTKWRLGRNVQRTRPYQLLHQQTSCLVRGVYLKMEADCCSECYFGGFK